MEEPNKTGENGRNPDGTFAKGNPGSPGRPKKKSFRDYFNEQEEADLIDKIKAEIQGEAKSEIVKMVVEQIFGKPKQPLTGGDDDDNPIKVSREVNDEDIDKLISIYERNKQNRTAEIDITE